MRNEDNANSPSAPPSVSSAAWDDLLQVVTRLRRECPWDREQTPLSIARYVVQEAYELLDAATRESWTGLQEEVGDLLFQMGMLLAMAKERGAFREEEPLESAKEKLVRRHPHVFGSEKVRDSDEVAELWERVKKEENGEPEEVPFRATGVASRDAVSLQNRAAKKGFDWPGPEGVLEKLEEERVEMLDTLEEGTGDPADELGDLLFTVVNLARHLRVDPDEALANANRKFWRRFQSVERSIDTAGRPLSLDEMEASWQAAKKDEAPKP